MISGKAVEIDFVLLLKKGGSVRGTEAVELYAFPLVREHPSLVLAM